MRPFLIALSLFTSLTLMDFAFAQADQAAHMKTAREHINVAIQEGQKGDATALVKHAEVGLEHAKMAQKIKSLPDLDSAVKSLDQAILLGRAGDAKKATEHAKEAMDYLGAAIAALGG